MDVALAGFKQAANHLVMGTTRAGGSHLHQQGGIARRVDQRHLLSIVLNAPTRRGGHRNAQGRVVEVLAAHQPLFGTVAKSQAAQHLLVTLTPFVAVAALVLRRQLVDLLQAVGDGSLETKKVETDPRFVTTVMMVSGGYPGSYQKGKVISGLEKISGSIVFHSGTKSEGDRVVTSGGRVLAVSSWGHSMQDALDMSYSNIGKISFKGSGFRKDIGFDL